MKWCSTYLYRSTQRRRARDMIKFLESAEYQWAPCPKGLEDIECITETWPKHITIHGYYEPEIKH